MNRWILGSALGALAAVGIASDAMAYGPQECRDPWIAQAMYQNYRRMPFANSPVTEECDITHYNGGHWNTYGDLVGYVRRAAPASPPPYAPLGQALWDSRAFRQVVSPATFNSLPQRNANGVKEVQIGTDWYVIAAGGGNLVSTNGGNVIASGGGNFIGHDAGNSTGVIAAGAGNVIAAGGGNITLYKAR
jgi:hypothetical protein